MLVVDILLVILLIFSLPFIFYILAILWVIIAAIPYGAGRILSRSQAKKRLDISEFEKEMDGIYTTCISKDTLDEAPMAYKSMQSIIEHIGDTIEILDVLKPIYNFKA